MPKLTAKQEQRFNKAVEDLNQLMEEIRQKVPQASYYLACNTLHVMSGDAHEGVHATARQDRIMASKVVDYADGGDW